MTNRGTMTGSIDNKKSITGNMINQNGMTGRLSTGGGGGITKHAVLYVKQELTEEQASQARNNIQVPGVITLGKVFVPYVVDEENDYAYIYDDPVEAGEGAEIFNDYANNMASGLYATARGFQTQAIGNYSIAEGWWTRADGQCAVASGLLTRASGHFSHAEGTRTQATINNAHAEGDMTIASGRQSHAEGAETVASGYCSHSEGYLTKATNYYSHAEGHGTIAAGRNQTAMGKFNKSDTTSLLIIGNGTKDSVRSNAHTVDTKGNAWYAGTIEGLGNILKSPNGTRFLVAVNDDGTFVTTDIKTGKDVLSINSESIKNALGYTPVSEDVVSNLSKEIKEIKNDIGDAEILLAEI